MNRNRRRSAGQEVEVVKPEEELSIFARIVGEDTQVRKIDIF